VQVCQRDVKDDDDDDDDDDLIRITTKKSRTERLTMQRHSSITCISVCYDDAI